MAESSHAVFLSYASQDAEAAQKICDALRAAGIEVFLDHSELRGGDAWDQKIRREIHDCALFIPVISANTASRHEGYFRLEWDLADQRTHMIARSRVFVVPVCLDATTQMAADVPESFQRVQWTRLADGDAPPAFVERIKLLLSPEPSPLSAVSGAGPGLWEPRRVTWRSRLALLAMVAMVVVALGYLAANRLMLSKRGAEMGVAPAAQSAAATPFNPPPHSIAVLPFVNMSGDPTQEYFSDGLTEEVLNSLARINELQVAARTSAFTFKGKDTDIGTVARRLNVGAVLEGSVRRSAHTIRITAQLINAVTGFHLWSQTYDRDLVDVLKLQTEIATAVAQALKVTLLGDILQRIELGGSHNPAAFDAYLRGRRIVRTAIIAEELQKAVAAYTDAVRLDPEYALAYAERSVALTNYATVRGPVSTHEAIESALRDARTAINLAPDLAEGYFALGVVLSAGSGKFAQADEAYARAVALAPGSARILSSYSRRAAEMGHSAEAITAGRRAIALDPLNFNVHRTVGIALLMARQYPEALAAFQTAIALQPDFTRDYILLGKTQYAMGAYEAARKSCEVAPDDELGQVCLAMTYEKLGRDADARDILQKMKSNLGDAGALAYAEIYAQWGEPHKAIEWLETAIRLSNSGLQELKAYSDFDPLREEPRFQAILRALKFP